VPTSAAPAFIARLLEAITRVPGVVSATVDGGAPVSGSARGLLYIAGRPVPRPNEAPVVLRHYVAPDHFRTLGIPLLTGRVFTAADIAGRPNVAVISKSAAQRFWPNQDPIGQRVWFSSGSGFSSPDSTAEIVGVVGDVVHQSLDEPPNRADVYTPYAQFTYAWRMFMVRTTGDPVNAVGAIRKAVQSVEPDLPLTEVQSLAERIGNSWSRHRFDAILFGGFAAVAILLATAGIYAVVAYAVTQRTREMGIRMALGARPAAVVRLVVREGMTFPLAGLLAGVIGAAASTRVLRASLYEITPTDPVIFSATVALLLGVSVVACLAPARRATRVDPLEALRAE
jgi:predicted permease